MRSRRYSLALRRSGLYRATLATVAATLTAAAITSTPAVASAQPVPVKTATSSTPDPNALTAGQALAQAKQSGQPVIATGLTTPTEQTTANANGTLTLTQSVSPVRTRRSGAWVGLDATLARNGDGSYSPAATASPVTLSGGGSGPLATLDNGGHQLALTFPMTLPAPTVTGSTATYPNVLPDVDLVVTIDQQGGFADTLVVKTAAAAANPALTSLTINTGSRDLRTSADSNGGLAVTEPAGRPVYTAPTPMMWDSAAAPATAGPALATVPKALAQATGGAPIDATTGQPLDSTPVAPGEGAHEATVGVSATNGGITLTPNQPLLTASTTVFPVYVDPTLNPDYYGGTADWTEVESGVPNYAGWHQSGLEQVGYCGWNGCNSINTTRSYFQWGITPLFGTKVLSSQVNFTEEYSPACSAPSGSNGGVALEWTWPISPSTTWNNQPSWNWTGMNNNGMYGYNSGCPAQGIGFDVTSYMTQDVNASSPTITFGLFAAAESDKYGWKEFADSATMATTYDVTPATPYYPNTSPGGCATGTPYPVIGKTDILLGVSTARASDNVAKPLAIEFKVTNLSTNTVANDQTIQTTAGSMAAASIPMGTLGTGDYSWTSQANDGALTSGWSHACYVHVDTSQPGSSLVDSPEYHNSTQGSPARTPGTFTFTPGNGSSTPTSYRYQLNSGVPVTVTPGSTGVWTGTITPTRVGANTLTVQALSAAGTPSTANSYIIDAAGLATPDPDGDFTGSGHPGLLTVGGTGGTAPGLWLSTSDGQGNLGIPTNIGLRGTGQSAVMGNPTDWNGALITHGQFTGDGMQDILAVLPGGTTEIYTNPGDGTALLNPAMSQSQYGLQGKCFLDPNWSCLTNTESITQIAAIGHLPEDQTNDSGGAYPDLVAVVNDTGTDAAKGYQLWWIQHGDGVGNYQSVAATVLDSPLTNSHIDWSTKTITGTTFQGKPALIVRDNTSGEVDLYPTCTASTCTGANGWFADAATGKIVMVPAGSATTTASAPALASEDANGDGNPDLWAIGATGAASFAAGTAAGTVGGLASAGTVIPPVSANLTPMGAANWTNPATNQNQTDVFAYDPAGNLWDYQRMPSGILGPPTKIGTGWTNFTVFGVADFNHDGYPDLIVRNNANCNEYVYPGSASGFASSGTQIGVGWCGYTPFGIEDWYHNGHYDVLARSDGDGNMWLYPGDITGGTGNRVQIGSGWNAGTFDPWGIIDFNGDNHQDIITRYEPTDIIEMYPGDGTGGGYPSNGIGIGGGFNSTTFFGFLYYDGTSQPELLARQNSTGTLKLYTGNGTGGWTNGTGVPIANGW